MADRGAPQPAPTEGDDVLLRLIAERNEAALGMLYEMRSGFLYSLALNIVKHAADAEEVTQDVFIRVWNKAHTFDPTRGSALAWLVTLTRRLAIDRTRAKQHKAKGRESSLEAVAESAGKGQRELETSVQASEIVGVLDQLQPQHREVINLAYFEGLSHSAIAEHLDTPLGTVKSRIREAVIQLRQALGVKPK